MKLFVGDEVVATRDIHFSTRTVAEGTRGVVEQVHYEDVAVRWRGHGSEWFWPGVDNLGLYLPLRGPAPRRCPTCKRVWRRR